MKEYKNKINELKVAPYGVYPDIELYMDQVLAYILRTPVSFKESEGLTSAMVNNYIKDGLIKRANGKKYNKEHITDLTLVARLKQVLAVKDVGLLISSARENREDEQFYNLFSEILSEACQRASAYENENASVLALRLAVESYVNKVACEDVLNTLAPQSGKEEEKKKKKGSDKE